MVQKRQRAAIRAWEKYPRKQQPLLAPGTHRQNQSFAAEDLRSPLRLSSPGYVEVASTVDRPSPGLTPPEPLVWTDLVTCSYMQQVQQQYHQHQYQQQQQQQFGQMMMGAAPMLVDMGGAVLPPGGSMSTPPPPSPQVQNFGQQQVPSHMPLPQVPALGPAMHAMVPPRPSNSHAAGAQARASPRLPSQTRAPSIGRMPSEAGSDQASNDSRARHGAGQSQKSSFSEKVPVKVTIPL
eukprot:gnl/TRDRNA2_/TRDRNA2_121156_c0_seq1.p1 gnl/TRDRNA2_/TRDRNA2_121156_c0~~gnl/TRDRNA2_/TRDRNA2_121156_c0_seq1.p1  ORF type:complete len:237 (-),score=40.91 gnl/TRDRNA2_/TRDRNA2_121156_c0_seq1:12-722(-)